MEDMLSTATAPEKLVLPEKQAHLGFRIHSLSQAVALYHLAPHTGCHTLGHSLLCKSI